MAVVAAAGAGGALLALAQGGAMARAVDRLAVRVGGTRVAVGLAVAAGAGLLALAWWLARDGMEPASTEADGPVVVAFTSVRPPPGDVDDGYGAAAERMVSLAREQPGFLGITSARDPTTRLGITLSYWRSDQAARNWKREAAHVEVQREGRRRWYASYRLVVGRILRDYGGEPTDAAGDKAGH